LRHEVVHTYDEDVFVMGAIEDGDLAPCRRLRLHTPQEVMCEFPLGWFFEVGHMAAIGIHRSDDVFDYTVFAASIKCLKNDQQRTFAFRKQTLLKVAHFLA